MSGAVEILSLKGLELALQKQQITAATIELPDFVTSRQEAHRACATGPFVTICSCFGEISSSAAACLQALHVFIETHARPGECEWLSHVASTNPNRWQPVPVIERLKLKAKVYQLLLFMIYSP
jgi:hypothetical protein